MSILNSFSKNIVAKLDSFSGHSSVQMSVWGNDLEDNFCQNIEFSNFLDELSPIDGIAEESIELILIVGHLNKQSLCLLKEQIKRIKTKFYTIQVSGAMTDLVSKKSYNLVGNLADEIDVDYVYKKYPYKISEIINIATELRVGHHD